MIEIRHINIVHHIVRIKAHRIVDDSKEKPRQKIEGKTACLLPGCEYRQEDNQIDTKHFFYFLLIELEFIIYERSSQHNNARCARKR